MTADRLPAAWDSYRLQGSYAQGPYLDRSVAPHLNGAEVEDFDQKITGLAMEYGIRHLSLTSEIAFNSWESPNIVDGAGGVQDLKVIGFYAEATYKLAPGLQAAGRYSNLRYDEIDDGTGSDDRGDSIINYCSPTRKTGGLQPRRVSLVSKAADATGTLTG